MPTYLSLVNVSERDVQNVQELASVWGGFSSEVAEFDAEVRETYAVLGDVDFVVIFDATNSDEAFRVSLALERHGLDTNTMQVVDTEHFADLVKDF